MFCVVYSAPALGPAILDPEVGINLPAMVHGGAGVRMGRARLRRRHDHDGRDLQGDLREGRPGFLRVRVGVHEPGRRGDGPRHVDRHRRGGV